MEVRAATMLDAPAIGEAHAGAWRVAYSDIFAPEWLRGAVQERRRRWSGSLADCLVGESEVLVVETSGHVIGFVHFGPSEEEVAVGELFALYVHPDHWGSGAAQLLSRHARERLGAMGFERIVLWALAGAVRARRFYEQNGWVMTGRTAERDFGDGHSKEVIQYSRSHDREPAPRPLRADGSRLRRSLTDGFVSDPWV